LFPLSFGDCKCTNDLGKCKFFLNYLRIISISEPRPTLMMDDADLVEPFSSSGLTI